MRNFSEIQNNIRESYAKKILVTVNNLREETNFKGIQGVILFGSVARGEDLTSSDIDICLITDDDISNHDRCEAKYTVLDDAEYPYVDCVTIKESNFIENPNKWRLYDDIKRDGVIIYENEKKRLSSHSNE